MKTRVLLVDDQMLFVESLSSVLQSRAADIEIVGTVHSGHDAVAKAEELSPDVILMDVRMPDMDGVEATRLIRERDPESKVVMLTTYDDDLYVHKAVQQGAIGYILKDISPEDLIHTIHSITSGTFLMSSSLADRMLTTKGKYEAGSYKEDSLPEWFYTLSIKERQILKAMIEGNTHQEIAQLVNLAHQTVRNYLSDVYQKLGVHGRMEAIKEARRYLDYL